MHVIHSRLIKKNRLLFLKVNNYAFYLQYIIFISSFCFNIDEDPLENKALNIIP